MFHVLFGSPGGEGREFDVRATDAVAAIAEAARMLDKDHEPVTHVLARPNQYVE